MKASFAPHRRTSAFTLVEMMVSVSVLALIMLVLVSMTNQISQTWRSTTGKIEQFQGARDGFESMTRKIGQATLNTYWDMYYVNISGRQAPRDFLRQSQLRFVSGPMSKLAPDANRPTHGIFFQAPLGFVEDSQDLGRMENLLNTWGYFVEVGDESDSQPAFLAGRVPNRWRSRLMELMQPAESMSVYDLDPKGGTAPLPGSDSGRRQLEWFSKSLTGASRPVRPVAENIIALVIWPKLSKQDEDLRRASGKSVLSPNYTYDSSLLSFTSGQVGSPQFPIFLNDGAKLKNKSDLGEASEINPKNQLPPIVQVTMVAVDELSASRLNDAKGNKATIDLVEGLFTSACAFGSPLSAQTQYEQDLKELEKRIVAAKLTYRVFSTNVSIRGAKWSTSQTK